MRPQNAGTTMAAQLTTMDRLSNSCTSNDACGSNAGAVVAEGADKSAVPLVSPVPGEDRSSRALCQSMKMVLLALLDRIEALESEVHSRNSDSLDLRNEVNEFEGALIRAALASTQGRQRRAARVLGMKVSTLNAKMRRYHVS
jgi:transcriptional regulator with GAF, ATPase, and Fis domain